ncbi:MAG: SAM-dependent DNA methyltransferase [Phycisphaerae bacterium]|nr:SAM-dependent DNA methyltransferase [Phycisphaerae bacterium]
MTDAELRYNERAWAIDLIVYMNSSVEPDGIIQRVSGEHTISTSSESLFPDVLLFGDHGNVLQGWELKMPDTAIDNTELISNAERKARNLGLDSFVVWNVQEADLYILNSTTDVFSKQYDPLFLNPDITTRADVLNRPDLWKEGAEQIIRKLNSYLSTGVISGVSANVMFSDTGLIGQLLSCQSAVKAFIESKIQTDNRVDAQIKLWWKHVKHEYPGERTPSGPLAYRILFRWFNRFVFANILKAYNCPLEEIDRLDDETTVENALGLFSEVSRRTDFWNVFGPSDFDDLIPQPVWNTLLAFNDFIQDFEFGQINRSVLQSILKSTVLASIKKAAGLFVTPPELARLLVLLTLEDKTGLAIDPFCGTGTIVKTILEVKSDYNITGRQAVETTWGSDKFAFPVQVSTLAVSTPENMHEPLRIFTHDALTLSVGENIPFVDPSTGENISVPLPRFSAIISNLPFVQFEDFAELNQIVTEKINVFYETHSVQRDDRLDGRGDIYSYIPFILYDLLEVGGHLGIIVSNSWLSTGWGAKFRQLLRRFYNLKYVLTSANARWFNEADIVTNLLICQKKSDLDESDEIRFIATQQNLSEVEIDDIDTIATDILAENFQSESITASLTSQERLSSIESLNIGLSACFASLDWMIEYLEKFQLLSAYTDIIRGERWGRNSFYYLILQRHNGSRN